MNMPKENEEDSDPYDLWSYVPESEMGSEEIIENHTDTGFKEVDPVDSGRVEDMIVPDSYDGIDDELEDGEAEVESKENQSRDMTFLELFMKILIPMWDPKM